MTKYEWDKGLKKALQALPQEEREQALEYYNEMFEDKFDRGMSESAILKEFGTPQEIANRILAENQAGGGGTYIDKSTNNINLTIFNDGKASKSKENINIGENKQDNFQYQSEEKKEEKKPRPNPYQYQYDYKQSQKKELQEIFKIILNVIAVGFSVVLCIVGVALYIAAVATVGSIAIASVVGGIMSVALLATDFYIAVVQLGLCVVALGLGVLIGGALFKLGGLIFKLIRKQFKWINSLFKKGATYEI